MSRREAVLKFFEEAKTNAALRAALADTESGEEAIAVARKFGYDFSSRDVADAREAEYGGAVDDAAIGDLSGGAPDDPSGGALERTNDPMRYWGTPRWRQYWGRDPEGYDY